LEAGQHVNARHFVLPFAYLRQSATVIPKAETKVWTTPWHRRMLPGPSSGPRPISKSVSSQIGAIRVFIL
jgi:hypothetical protein